MSARRYVVRVCVGHTDGIREDRPVMADNANMAKARVAYDVQLENPHRVVRVLDVWASQKVPESGYAYVAKGDLVSIRNDDWETKVITPRGDEYVVGRIRIDGTMCRVWWSTDLQANVAQVEWGELS